MKYHYEVIGGYLRDPNPATLTLLMAEDSAERIAKMVDGKWSYHAPYRQLDETRQYKTAKGAKKRMDDWREETSWRQPDHFTGILWYCDMNTVERFRDPSWTSDLDYSGLVIEINERISSGI